MITLTPREKQILLETARGMHSKQIAADLSLSFTTIKKYIMRLNRKLCTQSRTAAIMNAYTLGLIGLPDIEWAWANGVDAAGQPKC